MRLLVGSLILATSAAFVSAQQPTTKEDAVKAARVIAELTAVSSKMGFKNSPFSADEVNESVQTLADGNRIVRSSTGKMYRNSDGRVRREHSGGGSVMGSLYTTGQGVSILNPSVNQKYLLDTQLKTAQVVELANGQGISIAGARLATTEQEKANAMAKLQTELKAKVEVAVPVAPRVAPLPPMATGQGGYAYTVTGQNHVKYETRTEELGTRDFEGVSAEGTRKTTIIPAGAIGNERPIEIVYERWFSKDLGLVVFSRNNDPRFGEQTYKLTNIIRSEPDPSLFSVPTEYRRVTESTPVYRATGRRSDAERAVVSTRSTQAVTPTSKKAKPQPQN
jgi:hypothetical protein